MQMARDTNIYSYFCRMPRIIGDNLIVYKKKKAKKSCLAASLLGVDDDSKL